MCVLIFTYIIHEASFFPINNVVLVISALSQRIETLGTAYVCYRCHKDIHNYQKVRTSNQVLWLFHPAVKSQEKYKISTFRTEDYEGNLNLIYPEMLLHYLPG
jgi:hypothetical protein